MPLWPSATSRAMNKPSPRFVEGEAPPADDLEDSCTSGSKMTCSASAGMGSPRFFTWSTNSLPSARALKPMGEAGSPCCTALFSRFERAWRRRDFVDSAHQIVLHVQVQLPARMGRSHFIQCFTANECDVARGGRHRYALAQLRARVLEKVADHVAHLLRAALDLGGLRAGRIGLGAAGHQVADHPDRAQGAAKVMRQDSHERVARKREFGRVARRRFRDGLVHGLVEADHVLHHVGVDLRGAGCASRA